MINKELLFSSADSKEIVKLYTTSTDGKIGNFDSVNAYILKNNNNEIFIDISNLFKAFDHTGTYLNAETYDLGYSKIKQCTLQDICTINASYNELIYPLRTRLTNTVFSIDAYSYECIKKNGLYCSWRDYGDLISNSSIVTPYKVDIVLDNPLSFTVGIDDNEAETYYQVFDNISFKYNVCTGYGIEISNDGISDTIENYTEYDVLPGVNLIKSAGYMLDKNYSSTNFFNEAFNPYKVSTFDIINDIDNGITKSEYGITNFNATETVDTKFADGMGSKYFQNIVIIIWDANKRKVYDYYVAYSGISSSHPLQLTDLLKSKSLSIRTNGDNIYISSNDTLARVMINEESLRRTSLTISAISFIPYAYTKENNPFIQNITAPLTDVGYWFFQNT